MDTLDPGADHIHNVLTHAVTDNCRNVALERVSSSNAFPTAPQVHHFTETVLVPADLIIARRHDEKTGERSRKNNSQL